MPPQPVIVRASGDVGWVSQRARPNLLDPPPARGMTTERVTPCAPQAPSWCAPRCQADAASLRMGAGAIDERGAHARRLRADAIEGVIGDEQHVIHGHA